MRLLLALILLFSTGASVAADPLSRFLDGLHAYSADFEQIVSDANGEETERSQGRLLIERPGHFRWEYLKPYPQLIVADGHDLYLYDPDLEQVTIKPMDAGLQRTPALLLTSDRPLDESFTIGAETHADGLDWIDLQPKQDTGDFKSIRVGFQAGALAAMRIVDGFGQTTQLRFSNGRRDPPIPADAFVFTPPEGTDVIRAPQQE